DAPPRGGRDQPSDRGFSAAVDHRLRRLDHELETKRSGGQSKPLLRCPENAGESRYLFGRGHLGKSHHEILRKLPRCGDEAGEKDVERAPRPLREILGKWLDPYADRRWKGPRSHSGGDFRGGGGRVAVLFAIRAIAIPVFEVDAVILDRLTAKL